MHASPIAELLDPYIVGLTLPPGIYDQLSAYLDLLLRWNAKTNLTAIREPEQIATRHFGESLFAAGVLFGSEDFLRLSSRANLEPKRGGVEEPALSLPKGPASSDRRQPTTGPGAPSKPGVGLGGIRDAQASGAALADLGSGAGFPGIPIKLAFPELHVTLIESQNKKATFLKEVIRTLKLDAIEVFNGRAEHWGRYADVVTLRAVERFESVLPVAARLVAPHGRLCLLVGDTFDPSAIPIANLNWQTEIHVPGSERRKILLGSRTS